MIKKFKIEYEYAIVVDPDNHEDERRQLFSEGYVSWKKHKIDNEFNENNGKIEELFYRPF